METLRIAAIICHTVYDELLATVNFGEIVQKTFWRIKYWRMSHTWIHIPMQEYLLVD